MMPLEAIEHLTGGPPYGPRARAQDEGHRPLQRRRDRRHALGRAGGGQRAVLALSLGPRGDRASSFPRDTPSPRSSSAIPEEGGLYVWTTKAFGQRQGFLAGWLYWASNITYFPTLTLSTVVFALYVFGTRFANLEQSPAYAAGASLVLLAIALVFNIVGMKTGKWVQNIGGLSQWLPSLRLLVVGLLALFHVRLGHADAGGVADAEFHGASDRPLLRQPLLRIRRTGARALHGGRGRRAAKDFPARDRDLGPLDRRRLPDRDDLADVGAAARTRSRSSPASTRRSPRRARSTGCRGSERPSRC